MLRKKGVAKDKNKLRARKRKNQARHRENVKAGRVRFSIYADPANVESNLVLLRFLDPMGEHGHVHVEMALESWIAGWQVVDVTGDVINSEFGAK